MFVKISVYQKHRNTCRFASNRLAMVAKWQNNGDADFRNVPACQRLMCLQPFRGRAKDMTWQVKNRQEQSFLWLSELFLLIFLHL
ncbi:hypothetical protein E5358_04215 [Palleniella muris]|uniref:Uncharacterized protein n=1 Tax=Palleniella muris TaxID=3038145 RepID=A0AC61QS30_9BACT|nr:hypothetical protein [Palleniella muris]TGX83155.1 hypothetical protein E5358_04215 [Palleniella muris]